MSARTSRRPGVVTRILGSRWFVSVLAVLTRILGSQWFVSVLAVLIAFAIGAILIALSCASVLDS